MSRHPLGYTRLMRWRLVCERCGHEWKCIGDPPESCAKCKSKYWDHPRGSLKMGPKKK